MSKNKDSNLDTETTQDFENTYEVISDHESKICASRYSSALNNKCKVWATKQYKSQDKVKSLLIEDDNLVVIEKGHGYKIPMNKVVLVKTNDFNNKMEVVTSKPIKTGIKLSGTEIAVVLTLGILALAFGIVKFKGVKTKNIAPDITPDL